MKSINEELKGKIFLISYGIFLWWILSNIKEVSKYIGILLGALLPLIIGLIIAFVLNLPMMFFENNLLRNFNLRKGPKRALSLLLTFLTFIALGILLFTIVVPNLIETGIELSNKFPSYLNTLNTYISRTALKNSELNNWIEAIDVENVKNNLYSFVRGGAFSWISNTYSIAVSVFGGIISFTIGLIFAIYFLIEKEEVLRTIKKLLTVIFPVKIRDRIIYIEDLLRQAFTDFIVTQSIEALILGSMFFISMLVFRLPYAAMISVVIGFSALIPMVGVFIGLFVGIILIFVESPKLAGLFIVLFIVLQQIEGNIIYPRLVKKISGLSPLLTLVAVTVGGSLMGVVGMILFVPIFSVVEKLLADYMK